MKLVFRLAIGLGILWFSPFAHADEPAAALPTVQAVLTPTHISEDREKNLKKMDLVIEGSRKLSVTARVEGVEFKETRGWGRVIVTEAKDNTGKSLKIKVKKPKPKAAETIDPADDDDEDGDMADAFQVIEPPEASIDPEPLIEIELALPKRKATRIATLKGEFLLVRGGEIKEVLIDHLLDHVGQPIEDAVLKEAGIEILISQDTRQDESINPSSLLVKMKGKATAVAKMEIYHDNGKKASIGGSYRTPNMFATTAERDFETDYPLDNTMSLKIHVMVGQETVRVPFDLTDIPLP